MDIQSLPMATDTPSPQLQQKFRSLYGISAADPATILASATTAVGLLPSEHATVALLYVETNDIEEVAARTNRTVEEVSRLLSRPRITRVVQLVQMDMLYQMEKGTKIDRELIQAGILRSIHALESRGKYEATFKGYELLGKSIAMFTENLDVGTNGGTPISDADRAKRLAAIIELAKARAANTVDAEVVHSAPAAKPIPPQPPTTPHDEELI